jgi:starch synthase
VKICFAASEAVPYAMTGGLAEVAAALPPRVARLGHEVRQFLPFYSEVERTGHEFPCVDRLRDVPVSLGPTTYAFSARLGPRLEADHTFYFIDCPALYARPELYTTDHDEAHRFALFCRAVVECCRRMAWAPDVFHCHDWHTALIPFLLRTVPAREGLFRQSRCLLTIHNLGYQGDFPDRRFDDLGLAPWTHVPDPDHVDSGHVNFLRLGIVCADAVSTVSPTYAREILTEAYGMGLAQLLRARQDPLAGILNGMDCERWSPERDRFIPHRFSAHDLAGKRANKRYLLERLHLEPEPRAPLLGVISRFVHQKGFDLCFDVLPEIVSRGELRLVALGSGEPHIEAFFEQLQRRFPRRVRYQRGYHEELAHLIQAASDMVLMPSRYEPCGLNQMYAMRYGTLPIVRRTGGLADTVRPFDEASGDGTGFAFERFTPDDLRRALERALEVWSNVEPWRRLMRQAMRQDFSWETRVLPYAELYRKLGEA